jgi:hypothetical protein
LGNITMETELLGIYRMKDHHVLPDHDRAERIGISEAVLCDSKDVDQIAAILENVRERGGTLLLTRLSHDQVAALPENLTGLIDYDRRSRTAIVGLLTVSDEPSRIAVVTAGTSDVGVAQEAVRTLAFHKLPCREIYDVGVAGLWRLQGCLEEIAELPVVIVVAGMDAALVSVIAGLVRGTVIAVPTSTGYGVAEGGRTALNAALTSCAPGIAVVNIDNGYGAACAAVRVVNGGRRSIEVPQS